MKTKDKEFIREIISSDLKHILNPGFTNETLEKIAESERIKKRFLSSGDITFLIPQILHVSLLILISTISGIISWNEFKQKENIIYSVEKILGFLLDPVTVSILFSFSLLYLIDIFLQKGSTRFTKPDIYNIIH
jgi:hypothetical protein